MGNNEVKQVQEFVYLGGTICCDATCDKDISQRIGISSGVARNREIIWKAKGISKDREVLVYRTLLQSILLYNAETRCLQDDNGKENIGLHKKRSQVQVTGWWVIAIPRYRTQKHEE